jgi:hypothetical protein
MLLSDAEATLMSEVRKLAPIFVADVVGYSRLMGVDEIGPPALKAIRRQAVMRALRRSRGARVAL